MRGKMAVWHSLLGVARLHVNRITFIYRLPKPDS